MTNNVLLLTIDSLRIDAPLRYEGEISTFEELSEQGDNFDWAFATGPGTTPSFPAILCGTLPLSYGGLGPLIDERPRLSEQMKRAGLQTGGFQCNPFLSRFFNYDEYYDRFEDYQNPLMGVATKVFPRGIEINNPRLQKIDSALNVTDSIKKIYQLIKGKPRPYVSAEVITDDTIKWLQGRDDFFCWTHYMDVHHPCFPPEAYREQLDVESVTMDTVSNLYSDLLQSPENLDQHEIEQLERLYDASILYTNDQIDRIITHLEETGKLEDTLVILTSDHGELFGEHGAYGKPERLYDELLRVPLIVVNGPDYLEDATDDLVSLLDVPPIIHETLDIAIPDAYEGVVPGKDRSRNLVMAEHEVEGDVIVGARSENWLYEGDEIRNEHRLFNLQDGFRMVDQEQADSDNVRAATLQRLNSLDVDAGYLQKEHNDDVRDRLEDLGYL